MFALYLAVFMNGSTCSAVAVCDEDQPSCDAVIMACDGPVSMNACLNEAAAYAPGDDVAELEPMYGLGCGTDMAMGWPNVVVFDRDELERAQ